MNAWQKDAKDRMLRGLEQLHWKALAKKAVHKLGYSISRIDPVYRHDGEREDPFLDQRRILDFSKLRGPHTVFDVGANVGQSVLKYRATLPEARIHSFEPLPKAYRELRLVAEKDGNTVANFFALHATKGRREFLSNRGGANQTSSFLPPADVVQHSYPAHAFELEKRIEVETTTLDAYCSENGVQHIHILKMDTQGTELDILHGATAMLQSGAVTMAYVEILFSPLYQGNALYHDIASFMHEQEMDLFRIYYLNHGVGGRHIGGDALFVKRSLLRSFLDSLSETSRPSFQPVDAHGA
jgi:FkbM family methyltransferase